MSKKLLIPLGVFVVLCAFLLVGLWRDPREVPSPLIGKPAPPFVLSQLHEPAKTLGPADLKGQVWLLNVWASWCVSCREEHPLLVELGKAKIVPIVGLNYKDESAAGKRWLAQLGDPYNVSVVDRDGRVGIDWGVYGVPETFVVDKAGAIRYKQIGPITAEALEKKIMPLIRELQKS
jgi:cytochrome c biogenesis protein CcmG/thiol:disulfide interchange protein DsbE